MTDETALKAAIWCDPENDTYRLVYADYLDEHDGVVPCGACQGTGWTTRAKAGDTYATESPYLIPDFATVGCPRCDGRRDRRGTGSVSNGFAARAELIRVQCELARWKGKDHDHCPVCGKHWKWRVGVGYNEWIDCENDHRWCSMTHIDLRKRESALFAANAERWVPPILHAIWPGTSHTQAGADFTSAPGGRVNGSIRFARGFLDRVNLTLTDLTDTVAAALGSAGPLGGGVELRDRKPNDYGPPEDGCRFGWLSDREPNAGSAGLPRKLLRLFPPGIGRWPTCTAAINALDTAAASFCRLAAGYPPLHQPERIGAR